MKRFLPKALFLFVLFSFALGFLFTKASLAQYKLSKGSHSSTVYGKLGDFYLSLSGYIAPFASIVLYTDGVYLRATTADEKGYFTISEVLVKAGLSRFCFDAVDFRRLGESYSCMTVPPIRKNTTIKDIFLPPTLGLLRTTIEAGSNAVAFGYSMPNALVTLHFGTKTYTTTADSTGYYQFVVKDVKAGTYQLYATAVLDEKPSLTPERKLTLKSLSLWEQFLEWLKELLNKIREFFTSLSFGPLWLAIPILILIIILLLKLWPERFSFISKNKTTVFLAKKFKREHPLHHKYFMGY